MFLIHGLNGNENVMWIFTQNFPGHYWFAAPRAPYAQDEGFSWIKPTGAWPTLMDFSLPAAALIKEYRGWAEIAGTPCQPMDVLGFSQGAAMAFALAAFYPDKIRRVISLAGFLPKDDDFPSRYSSLEGKSIFIAHGRRDKTIPVEMAEEAIQTLTALGAQITYCPSDAGHKFSSGCTKDLLRFVNQPAV